MIEGFLWFRLIGLARHASKSSRVRFRFLRRLLLRCQVFGHFECQRIVRAENFHAVVVSLLMELACQLLISQLAVLDGSVVQSDDPLSAARFTYGFDCILKGLLVAAQQRVGVRQVDQGGPSFDFELARELLRFDEKRERILRESFL